MSDFLSPAVRQGFVRLRLPAFHPGSTCYLNSAAGMCLSAARFISNINLEAKHFEDPADMERALRTDTLWVWEEMKQNSPEPNVLRAASSLADLLASVPGADPAEQRRALEAFAQLFHQRSLCYNDWQEAGWVSAESFIRDYGDDEGFQDKADLAHAAKNNALWTLVDQPNTQTVLAASSLEKLLEKAWDAHPAVALQRALEAVPDPAPPSPRRPRV